ncbi:unnamed protein product, partial [Rotaria sp. Silwood1]
MNITIREIHIKVAQHMIQPNMEIEHSTVRNIVMQMNMGEYILSFDLFTIDKCRRNEFDIGRSMLIVQRWLKKYVHDVLDEILHVKYQLIYTVGGQQQVDGGAERWKTIQTILEFGKKHAADISKCFYENVCYKPSKRKKTHLSVEYLVHKFPRLDLQLFLIIRDLLSSEVLLVAFTNRYRVNYGVNPSSCFNRLMAVLFLAKDAVADRTGFSHPDVVLVLTQLSYYYSGLNE